MVVFPNAKINLGLNIVSKRSDGYHNLETVFYPIPLQDCIELIPSTELKFSSSGITVDCPDESNLCIKAFRSLQTICPDVPQVHIHLHKSIPFGAGLGGGSADASFVITSANKLFNLGLSDQQMAQAAAKVGSDCPFFVYNRPMFATGTGDQLEQIKCDLTGKFFVLVKPPISVNTATAYRGMIPRQPITSPKIAVGRPLNEWKEILTNDFEDKVFEQFPAISEIKNYLYKAGAIYSSMSGSGSSVFGIFDTPPPELKSVFTDYFVFTCTL